MKLDELHIGNTATCSPAHCDAVACRGIRISRVQINLAGSSGRKDGIARRNRDDFIA
jgi:hypothetical protein